MNKRARHILLTLLWCGAFLCSTTFILQAQPETPAADTVQCTPPSRDQLRRAAPRIQRYTDLLAERADGRARSVLRRIPSTGRRLFALKYYLIRSGEIDSLWTMSDADIREFKGTLEYAETMAGVQRVVDSFAVQNPGYQLHVDPGHRPLGKQIANWNGVRSVSVGASEIMNCAAGELSRPIYADTGITEALLDSFELFLRASPYESVEPTVALPGFSQHGQLRAFDFRVKRGSQLIAPATSSKIQSVWERYGWTERLKRATVSASDRFAGPLENPYEPWHYTWVR